jgi:formimidoylglutamate deiminase
MLRGGYTTVGEFHYVHRPRGGAHGSEMALAVREAARDVGIRIVMLPVWYQRGGFGRDPAPEQMAFVHPSLDDFVDLLQSLRDQPCGIAPHSLRAVPLATLPELVTLANSVLGERAPIHLHVSEQPLEVVECYKAHGRPPIQCLAETVELDARWSLVHATHAEPHEVAILKDREPNLVLCPLTEGYLGDGFFPFEAFGAARFAIGTDSNACIDAIEELRMAEYGQRLKHMRRIALAGDGDLGGSLWQRTCAAGARALAQPIGALAPGVFADITVLKTSDPLFAGVPAPRMLDAWITGGSAAQIESVYVGGQRRMDHGELVVAIDGDRFARVMKRIHGGDGS